MTAEQTAQGILARCRPLVEAEIRSLLADRSDALLYQLLRYHLGYADAQGRPIAASGGKGVRSALCLLACEAAGGQPARAAPAGAALELVHGFTLLHDDIADHDVTRRGRPTVWSLWGVGQAITAGDAMYALANLAVGHLDRLHLSPETAAGVLQELNRAVLEVCEGQQLDLCYQGRDDLDYADYLKMIGPKTASLFGAACGMGAHIGGADQETVVALRGFGSAIGLVYQIRDDALGIWGDPRELGKPVGSDLRQNKRTLPITLALSTAQPDLRQRVLAGLSGGIADGQGVAALAASMEEAGIRADCERIASELLTAALDQHLSAAHLPPRSHRELRALACHFAERTT
jgi:geranylgeranyl diphosphate synthase type I